MSLSTIGIKDSHLTTSYCCPGGALRSGGLKRKTLYNEWKPSDAPMQKQLAKKAQGEPNKLAPLPDQALRTWHCYPGRALERGGL